MNKSVDGLLGIRTSRMVGVDETTGLWQPPKNIEFSVPFYLMTSCLVNANITRVYYESTLQNARPLHGFFVFPKAFDPSCSIV